MDTATIRSLLRRNSRSVSFWSRGHAHLQDLWSRKRGACLRKYGTRDNGDNEESLTSEQSSSIPREDRESGRQDLLWAAGCCSEHDMCPPHDGKHSKSEPSMKVRRDNRLMSSSGIERKGLGSLVWRKISIL